MKIEESNDIEPLIEDDDHERNEIHLTDLVYCVLKGFYRLRGEPQKFQKYVMNRMRKGRLIHAALNINGYVKEQKQVFPYMDESGDGFTITATPDFLSEDLLSRDDLARVPPVLIEFKTTTRTKIDYFIRSDGHYIKQIKYYCAFLGINTAYLLIMNGNGELYEFKVEFTDSEIKATKSGIIFLGGLLNYVVNNPNEIRQLEQFAPAYDWECKGCSYRYKCSKYKGAIED